MIDDEIQVDPETITAGFIEIMNGMLKAIDENDMTVYEALKKLVGDKAEFIKQHLDKLSSEQKSRIILKQLELQQRFKKIKITEAN